METGRDIPLRSAHSRCNSGESDRTAIILVPTDRRLGHVRIMGTVRTLCFRVQHLSQACDRRKGVGPSDRRVELRPALSDAGRDAVSRSRSDMALSGQQRNRGVVRVAVRLLTKELEEAGQSRSRDRSQTRAE